MSLFPDRLAVLQTLKGEAQFPANDTGHAAGRAVNETSVLVFNRPHNGQGSWGVSQMTRIEWHESMRVGSAIIDENNRKLVELGQAFFDALEDDMEDASVGTMLNMLLAYADESFPAEERIMAEAGYPAIARQRDQHRRFAEKISALGTLYDRGDVATVKQELAGLLTEWVIGHIIREDAKVTPFIMNQARTG